MSFAEFRFRSRSLDRDTAVCVFLPDDGPDDDIPVLWLLHGMHGAYDSWFRKSNIERYAQRKRIAVVTPEGENSFYHDMKYGMKFFSFVSEELPAIIRRTFRISAEREKNFIAGLSMGGYGALRTALLRPDLYAGCASLSGCVDMVSLLDGVDADSVHALAIWGENFKTSVAGTDSDLFSLIRNFPAGKAFPSIYACCGRQDSLYSEHVSFRELLDAVSKERKIDYLTEEFDGIHDWVFWNKYIGRAVDRITGPYLKH
ncbi:MAG: esterase family protein [Clostridia bacterium]|nr:esterase family protein [Clostridia bacterium]